MCGSICGMVVQLTVRFISLQTTVGIRGSEMMHAFLWCWLGKRLMMLYLWFVKQSTLVFSSLIQCHRQDKSDEGFWRSAKLQNPVWRWTANQSGEKHTKLPLQRFLPVVCIQSMNSSEMGKVHPGCLWLLSRHRLLKRFEKLTLYDVTKGAETPRGVFSYFPWDTPVKAQQSCSFNKEVRRGFEGCGKQRANDGLYRRFFFFGW